jgi:hypothetical protein
MHVCHCGMCRRHAGGPTLSVSVGGITFQGDDNILRYKSSDYAERGTCNKCGGHLFYHLFSPDMYIMSIGAFDDQSRFTIGGEIFIDNKPAGYAFAGNHPRETEHEFLKRIGAISQRAFNRHVERDSPASARLAGRAPARSGVKAPAGARR